jgi:hypothetical protein
MVATDWGKRPNGEPDDREAWMRRSDRLLHTYPIAGRLRS